MPTRRQAVDQYCEDAKAAVADLDYYSLLASVRLALTLLPVARSLVAREIISPESRFAYDNVPTQMVARHLGVAEPQLSPDYERLSRMGEPKPARQH
jgi:hypothetical protein